MMDSLPYRNDAAHGAAPADPLAADAAGRPRRGHLRQGAAGDDDGPGGDARLAVRARARRRDAAADRRRGRRQDPDDRRPLRPRRAHARRRRPSSAAGPAPVPAAAASSWAPRPRRRSSAEALGLSLPHSALAPSGQPIWLDMARRSARALARAVPNRQSPSRHILTDAGRPQRHDRPRGVRRLDQSAAAHPGHRPRRRVCAGRRSRTGSPSIARCRAWSMCCPTARSAIRPCASSWPAACPEVMLHLRRLGLLDRTCLTVTGEPLGRVLDWWEKSERRSDVCATCWPARTASIPTTSS